jgi:hypothetical protein
MPRIFLFQKTEQDSPALHEAEHWTFCPNHVQIQHTMSKPSEQQSSNKIPECQYMQ